MAQALRKVQVRKTPRQERSRHTVAAVLDAAAQVFAARGYANTTTNHIAARAGLSIGSLYQYFPSKDAILLALAERHVESAFAAVLQAVQDKADAPIPVLLRALVDAVIRAHRKEPRLHHVIFGEAHPDARFRRRLEELDAHAMEIARSLIDRRCAELAIRNPEMASLLVVQVLEGVVHAMVMHHPEELGTQAFGDELVSLLESYLLGGREQTVEIERRPQKRIDTSLNPEP